MPAICLPGIFTVFRIQYVTMRNDRKGENNMAEEKVKGQNSWGEVLTYSFTGMFVLGFELVLISYYTNIFMTDILMIPTLMAATCNVVINIAKTATMALGGVVMDASNFKKGNISIWYFICNIGLAIFYPLTFTNLHLGELGNAIWFTACYCIHMFFYNTGWIATRAISGIVGKTNVDTVRMTSITNALAGLPAIAWPFIYNALAAGAFKNNTNGIYTAFALLSSVVFIIGGFIAMKFASPYELAKNKLAGGGSVAKKEKNAKIPISVMLKGLKGPGLVYLLAQTFACMQGGFFSVLLPYYATYVLKNPGITASTIMATSIAAMIGDVIVPEICKHLSKKTLHIGYQAIMIVLYIGLIPVGNNGTGFVLMRSAQTLVSCVNMCITAPFMVDIGDYYEKNGGSNARGFLQSMAGTATRLGGSLTSIFTGYALAWVGYQAGVEVTTAVAKKLTMLMVVGPAIFAALSSITMIFYHIDEKEMDEYRKERDAAKAQ